MRCIQFRTWRERHARFKFTQGTLNSTFDTILFARMNSNQEALIVHQESRDAIFTVIIAAWRASQPFCVAIDPVLWHVHLQTQRHGASGELLHSHRV